MAVSEESCDRHRGPGKAAVISTLILLAIYVVVSAAAQAFHGTKFLSDNADDVLSPLGHGVLGSPLYKLYRPWNFWTEDAEEVQALLCAGGGDI